jgi:3-mercaptopropionate dioxygenase
MAGLMTAAPLRALIADIDAIRNGAGTPQTIARAVSERLTAVLSDGSWLGAADREPAADRYRQHILHVADDGGFSVVSLVWKPGQCTPIHDHVAWCVVGVLEGVEEETRYRLYEEGGERFLVKRFARLARSGEAGFIVPPDEDIHEVRNAGETMAISIHVYGADIRALGTSINRTFDALPIRERPSGQPVTWRSTAAQSR